MAAFERTDGVEAHVTRGDGGREYPSAGLLSVTNAPPIYKSVDDLPAYFGDFGGRFIPETLMEAHTQLEKVGDNFRNTTGCKCKARRGRKGSPFQFGALLFCNRYFSARSVPWTVMKSRWVALNTPPWHRRTLTHWRARCFAGIRGSMCRPCIPTRVRAIGQGFHRQAHTHVPCQTAESGDRWCSGE